MREAGGRLLGLPACPARLPLLMGKRTLKLVAALPAGALPLRASRIAAGSLKI